MALDIPARWMRGANLLDVTLRDGGFRTGFQWTSAEVLALTRSVTAAGVNFVELGYLGGVPELHHVTKAGLTADVPSELVRQVKTLIPEAELALMIHPSALVASPEFSAYRCAGLAMVRFVYHSSWRDRLGPLITSARAAGLMISLNLALASRYSETDLAVELPILSGLEPDLIYIADTCAALTPSRVAAIVAEVRSTGTRVGFHAHDFLSLALANSLAAVEAGADFVDVSVLGLGRGAGNLRTELWLALQAAQGGMPVTIEALIEAMEMVEAKLGRQFIPDLASIVSGAFNLSPPQEDRLRAEGTRRCGSANAAAALFGDHAKSKRTFEEVLDVMPAGARQPLD